MDENSIVDMKNTGVDFLDVVKKRYIEKNADTALKIIEEYEQLKKATTFYEGLVTRLKEGDATVFEEYKKKRSEFEDSEEYVF